MMPAGPWLYLRFRDSLSRQLLLLAALLSLVQPCLLIICHLPFHSCVPLPSRHSSQNCYTVPCKTE